MSKIRDVLLLKPFFFLRVTGLALCQFDLIAIGNNVGRLTRAWNGVLLTKRF